MTHSPLATTATNPPCTNLLGYPETDIGNAAAIAARYGDRMKYCPELARWLVWDGRRWEIDETGLAMVYASETAKTLEMEAHAARSDSAERNARRLGSVAGIRAALRMAALEDGIWTELSALDRHPFLLNCQNGVLDLRTGKLAAHDRDLLLTKVCAVDYDQEAQCPRFQAAVDAALGDNAGFLQRAFGYALTGDVSERTAFVLYGPRGGGGGTTLLAAFMHAMGDYAAWRGAWMTAGYDLLALRCVGGVLGDWIKKSTLRRFIGGAAGEMIAEHHGRIVRFPSSLKLFSDSTCLPRLKGQGDPLNKLLKLIPFTHCVEKPDPGFGEKLREEAAGILRWAVDGCLAWQKTRLGAGARGPGASAGYPPVDFPYGSVKSFLRERCAAEVGAFVRCADLTRAYLRFCMDSGFPPYGRSRFHELVRGHGYAPGRSRRQDRRQIRTWENLRLMAA